ncbi:hypothetical protein [Kitasatospora sp. NPDC005856]|uniref:Ig-like domain-containing protein n=1 Tax=Kitasatospora sp. NPDC005856 TaxID=3154566 RepID=UPI0033E7E214
MPGGRNVVRAGRAARAAAPLFLLALTAGCGGGGGGSSSGGTTSATVLPTAQTSAPTDSNPSAIATLFPGSQGGNAVATAKVPSTPLGGQSGKTVLLAAPHNPSENNTGTSTEAVTSTGTTIGAVHLSAGSFSVADNPCTGRTLQPGDTCTLTVTFSPTTVGTHTAELTVDTSAADAAYRVELIGEGVESGSASPSSPSPSSHSKSPTPETTPSPEITPPTGEPSAGATES